MDWSGGRGFDGIYEKIILPLEDAQNLKNILKDKEIYFGEINGKHSDICGTLEDKEITIIEDKEKVKNFLINQPTGWDYNHSFINQFFDDNCDDNDFNKEEFKLIMKKYW